MQKLAVELCEAFQLLPQPEFGELFRKLPLHCQKRGVQRGQHGGGVDLRILPTIPQSTLGEMKGIVREGFLTGKRTKEITLIYLCYDINNSLGQICGLTHQGVFLQIFKPP